MDGGDADQGRPSQVEDSGGSGRVPGPHRDEQDHGNIQRHDPRGVQDPVDDLSLRASLAFGFQPHKVRRLSDNRSHMESSSNPQTSSPSSAPATAPASAPAAPVSNTIVYDDFAKIELRVATVLECVPHPKADKLLILQVDLGTEKRQICAGLKQHYPPEQLVGKQIVVVANLAPRKMLGEISNGMLLAASDPATGR